jgi:hypothetical protein
MSMLGRSRFTWIFLSAFLFLFVALPSLANATPSTRVFPAAGCIPVYDSASGARISGYGQWYSVYSIGSPTIICPLTSDSTVAIPAASPFTASVTVHGYDNSFNSSFAWVCDQAPGGGVPVCSTAKGSLTTGGWTITPNLPSMTAGDYVYLVVTLGPVITGSVCTFWGYSLTNQ